jgi:hypothetical protein
MFRKVRCLLSSGTRSPARSLEYLMHQLSWAASLLRSCRSTSYPAPEPCDTRQTRSDPVLVLRSQVASNEQVEDRLWRLLASQTSRLPFGGTPTHIRPRLIPARGSYHGSFWKAAVFGRERFSWARLRAELHLPAERCLVRHLPACSSARWSRGGVLPLRLHCVHLQDRRWPGLDTLSEPSSLGRRVRLRVVRIREWSSMPRVNWVRVRPFVPSTVHG